MKKFLPNFLPVFKKRSQNNFDYLITLAVASRLAPLQHVMLQHHNARNCAKTARKWWKSRLIDFPCSVKTLLCSSQVTLQSRDAVCMIFFSSL
mmetsp:Transcript_6665/g.10742  ORF Transcript_6665/g.10742 Transcript_6665/m.10742 type:complete len:93 (-) Transcript_6665:29-307(-)